MCLHFGIVSFIFFFKHHHHHLSTSFPFPSHTLHHILLKTKFGNRHYLATPISNNSFFLVSLFWHSSTSLSSFSQCLSFSVNLLLLYTYIYISAAIGARLNSNGFVFTFHRNRPFSFVTHTKLISFSASASLNFTFLFFSLSHRKCLANIIDSLCNVLVTLMTITTTKSINI